MGVSKIRTVSVATLAVAMGILCVFGSPNLGGPAFNHTAPDSKSAAYDLSGARFLQETLGRLSSTKDGRGLLSHGIVIGEDGVVRTILSEKELQAVQEASRSRTPGPLAENVRGSRGRIERADRRTIYSRAFDEPDGRRSVESFLYPINYRNSTGGFLPIDPEVRPLTRQPEPFRAERAQLAATLKPDGAIEQGFAEPATGDNGSWSLANDTNLLKTYFRGDRAEVRADGINSGLTYAPTLLRFESGDQIDVIAAATASRPGHAGETVTYPAVFPGVDVVYETRASGISQRFIFHRPPRLPSSEIDPSIASIAIGETIRLTDGAALYDGLGRQITADAEVALLQIRAERGADILWIDPPYAVDASTSEGPGGDPVPGTYAVEFNDDGSLTLWTRISYEWFSAPERRYPIVVDPDLTLQPGAGAAKDTMLSSGALGNFNWGDYAWLMFEWSSGENSNGMIEFDLSGIPSGTTIDSAKLSLAHEAGNESNAIGIYNNLGPWSEFGTTWNNAPPHEFNPIDSLVPGAPGQLDSFDVTVSLQEMIDGVRSNFGWRISRVDGGSSSAQYRSSDAGIAAALPHLDVSYTPGTSAGCDQELAINPNGAAGKDTMISSGALADVNLGTYEFIMLNWAGTSDADGMIEFDLSPLASGTVVTSAVLKLWHHSNFEPNEIGIYNNEGPWDEASATWNNSPAFEAAPVDSFVPGAAGQFDFYDVTQSVQQISDGVRTNYGWRISRVDGGKNSIYYCSSDAADATKRPELIITYQSTGNLTLDVQPNSTTDKAALLYSGAPTVNLGNYPYLMFSASFDSDGIIEFPEINTIPSGSTIQSAQLILWHEFNTENAEVGIYNNLAAWSESTVTWGNAPPYDLNPIDSFVPGQPAKFESFDVTLSVQEMVDGVRANCGWRISRADGGKNVIYYLTSDQPDPVKRPHLLVQYTGGAIGPSEIDCPSDIITVNDPGLCGALVSYPPPAATDACGASLPVTCDPAPGSFFPMGTTTVNCTGSNGLQCSFTVTVIDIEAPVVTAALEPLAPPPWDGDDDDDDDDDHRFRNVFKVVATAQDLCDAAVTVTAVLQTECGDVVVANGDLVELEIRNRCKIKLPAGDDDRRRRRGPGPMPRIRAPVITLKVVATDGAGNEASAEDTLQAPPSGDDDDDDDDDD